MKYKITISQNDKNIVDISNFEIPQNRVTFLFGESGIGKSIIANTIYGLIDPEEFQITINDGSYKKYLQNTDTISIQKYGFFVFQEPSSHLNPLLTLYDQLNEGSISGSHKNEEILRELWSMSDTLDIDQILKIYPKTYRPSGGEKQRILLAMAFKKIDLLVKAGSPIKSRLFVFDEPSGNLDDRLRNKFISYLFKQFRRTSMTILLITHDYSVIGYLNRKHKSFLKNISFVELKRFGKKLLIHKFRSDQYLSWLDNRTKVSAMNAGRRRNDKILLKLGSGLKVFERKLLIFSDRSYKKKCSITVNRGEIVYLKAASGVGKTTLVKVIMGLIPCDKLDLMITDIQITEKTPKKIWRNQIWGKKAGMVFQHADEALNKNSKTIEVFSGLPGKKMQKYDFVKEWMEIFFEKGNLESILDKKVRELSGGQKQRLNLLRTLILDTDLIILDEPLNGLDFGSIKKIISILERKRDEGKGILVISHNEEIFDKLVEPNSVYYLKSASLK